MGSVYGLFDPRSGELRYVGKSHNPQKRLKQHLSSARRLKSHVHNWIMALDAEGMLPELDVIETVEGNADDAERFWIAYFRSIGANLTNLTGGGDGQAGRVQTLAERMSKAIKLRGHVKSPETCRRLSMVPRTDEWKKKISLAHLGLRHSPETRMRLAEASRNMSLETRSRIAEARRGKRHSPETRLRMSLSQSARRQRERRAA